MYIQYYIQGTKYYKLYLVLECMQIVLDPLSHFENNTHQATDPSERGSIYKAIDDIMYVRTSYHLWFSLLDYSGTQLPGSPQSQEVISRLQLIF